MKKIHYICKCEEGYIIPENEFCPICYSRSIPVRGKKKGFWANPQRDADIFVLKNSGWKNYEIEEYMDVTTTMIQKAVNRFKRHALGQ